MFPLRTITRRCCSLTRFLPDERSDGRRTVDKARWNVHAIVCPRARFREVRTSEEFPQPGVPGVYVLSSDYEEKSPFPPIIYIGKSDQLSHRLEQHYRQKDFWTSLIVFTSRSESFTMTHAEYLESQLISLAKKVKRCCLSGAKGRVQNNQQLRMLPPAAVAAMEVFLKEVLLTCDLLGFTAFEGPPMLPLPDDPPQPQKLR